MEYAFYKSFKFPVVISHSMNIFGERQHPEKFVPLVVRKILNNEKVPIHGIKGKEISSRCWIHAREVASAILFLLSKGIIGESYNIIGEEKDVSYIANLVSLIINNKPLEDIEWIDFHHQRPGHDLRYALDGNKLKGLGWEPKLTLEKSFEKMVDWMVLPANRHWLNL